jgi:hypothetical protein
LNLSLPLPTLPIVCTMPVSLIFARKLKYLLCMGWIHMKPTRDSFTRRSVTTSVIFKKCFLWFPTGYLSCITRKIYNNELFVDIMAMEGSSSIFKKTCQHSRFGQATSNNTPNKFPRFLCVCVYSLVRLEETFRVWWSWVAIINYTKPSCQCPES